MILRKSCCAATVFLLLVSGGACIAQEKSENIAASHLAPVEWFTRGPWYAEVKDPQSGAVIHVENTIEWAPNHAAIRFLTKFEGQPHYNGFYAYNFATKRIEFYYTSAEGELTVGYADPDVDGKDASAGVRYHKG
jgi:hypothetical protein